jgi:hypothetical protein
VLKELKSDSESASGEICRLSQTFSLWYIRNIDSRFDLIGLRGDTLTLWSLDPTTRKKQSKEQKGRRQIHK